MLKTAWLIFYNMASAGGWAYVLALALGALAAGQTPEEAWAQFGAPLMVVQTTMAFEIVHALTGLVRSPVGVTALQVSSRLWVVWGATYYAAAAQAHWSLYLMVVSWCCAEVPRYLFYVANLALPSIPFPLFFVRYSGFMVLYPTGITGEIFQCLASLDHWQAHVPAWFYALKVILVLYAPGSPFMIMNMVGNRKSAFKKRTAPAPAAPNGLVWPVTNAATGERGSTDTNKAIWHAALAAVNPAGADALRKVKNWRFGYAKQVEVNVRASLVSAAAALHVARAGLAEAHKRFEFARAGQPTVSLKEAMDTYTDAAFETVTIKGGGPKQGAADLAIPYGGHMGQPYYQYKEQRHQPLRGPALKQQLKAWAAAGVIEPDCAAALQAVADHPEWLDLSNHYFVLLGAGSAMGPLPLLLALGANVYAVDIDRPGVWKGLLAKARAASGSFTFPVRASKVQGRDLTKLSDDELAEVAGANLLADTPELATWLASVCPQQRVTVGNYTYLDGALHVQLSLACDAIIGKLAEQRPDLALAFLCTPTDCHVAPAAAVEASQRHLRAAPWWQTALAGVLGLKPNALKPVVAQDSGQAIYLVDGTVADQGPNYILAKRLQHWRAVVEFSNGHTISSNIAPSTATASVVHNAQFAAAYGGMHVFAPMEVMYAETSNAVMGALLVHDVRNPAAPASGANGKANKLANPLMVFMHGSFHGGTWRCGYKMGTIGVPSALVFYAKQYGLLAGAVTAAFVAASANFILN